MTKIRPEFLKQKINSLVSILRLMGAKKSVIDRVLKNGIPKCIMTGSAVPAEIRDALSFIAPVMKLSVALTANEIIFSWVENFDTMATSNINYESKS